MSADARRLTAVGVFGGTFNPIHYGHLRSALELVERLGLDHLRLMPCAVPPHREAPSCSAQDRLAMVELAVVGESRLRCDRRELDRDGLSYTYDSLVDLRGELGEGHSLSMVLGADAVQRINTWHRWLELLDVAHVVVLARPGWEFPREGEVAQWLATHRLASAAALNEQACGGVLIEELRPLAISSTEIRSLLAGGHSPRYLLPEPVLDYIQERQLYL
ncbi:nicotinic acid mononucleotide adenylyltransferase [Halioglobus sp. HI00S01]|uniref:nicotinate-nucleotide adenylyltransferase n=1 Tax=Halioglobus sp. HI00S01 TaxID=1822214 RepID=UPI0007C313A3|nr:nicotinate-nucleotide adenylyltransferase [Halioglobus sp. HI00S01]KZX56801.1 nicotinic acid mononucleotide adenylyltransferase [Halioglobus sp. HI00S01]